MARARIGSLWEQTRVLFKKNLLIKRRWRRQTMFEMFFPVYMTAIVCLINLAAEKTEFPAEPMHRAASLTPDMQLGVLGYIAHTHDQRLLVNTTVDILANSSLTPELRPFSSEDELLTWYNQNEDSLWAAVVFPQSDLDSGTLNYTIRMQASSSTTSGAAASVPKTKHQYSGLGDCRNNSDCTADLYRQSGFLQLQHSLQAAYHRIHGGNETLVPQVEVVKMPLPAYSSDANAGIRVSAVILTIMAFSPIIQYLMINVVSEKEKGIKDAFFLMGMRPLAYWLSWLLAYMLMLLVPCVLVTLISVFLGVLQNSSFIAVLVVLYVYSLSITCLAFVFTPFFSNSKVAGVAGSLSNTLISLVIFGLKDKAVSAATKYAVSIVSPCAASIALENMLSLDEEGGFNFSTFGSGSFSVGSAVLMMACDCVLYLALAWYLDAVVPGNGPTKSPLFFLHSIRTAFSSGTRAPPPLSEEGLILEGEREQDDDNFQTRDAVIRIENIGKSYTHGQRPALRNVTLRLFEGQIFGLLGHNGAGKTTLHSIITGLRQPTQGRVLVNGLDLRTDAGQDAMREVMGVCPQHDVLYDKLTVKEHLQIYSGIKGVAAADQQSTFRSLLHEIDLDDKADAATESLSGGQKRKLSVGIALIGDPQILCLDEPSSGMDPYSRRKLWELLQSKRAGRVTLLTTHYMQEADILADRKAILSRGRVQCVGSSLFLKSRYGVGYHLHVAKHDGFDGAKAQKVIGSHVRSAVPENSESSSTEVSFALPYAETRNFGPLFRELAERRGELGVRSFGVSMTTLEEVFVRLSRLEDECDAEEEQQQKKEWGEADARQSDGLLQTVRTLSVNAGHAEDAASNAIALRAQSGKDSSSRDDSPALARGGDHNHGNDGAADFAMHQPLLGATSGSHDTFLRHARGGAGAGGGAGGGVDQRPGMWQVVIALMVIRAKQSVREWRALFFQVVVPAILLVVSLTVIAKPSSSSGGGVDEEPFLPLTPDLYAEDSGLRVPVVDPHGSFASRLSSAFRFADVPSSVVPLPAGTQLQGEDGYLTRNQSGYSCAFEAGGVGNAKDTLETGSVSLFYNTTMVHVPAVYMAQVGNSFLATLNVSVQAASHPLPPRQEVAWDSSIFYTVMLLGIGLSVVPGGFAINTIKDRETKMKHLLEVSGVSGLAYWLADLLRSMSIFSVSVVFAIILTVAANVEPLIGPGLPLFILLCVVYMPLTILFAFLASYLFSNAETCQSVFPPLNNFLGFIPFIVVGTLDGLGEEQVAKTLHYVFAVLLPPYSLTGALYYMFRLHTVAGFNHEHPHATSQDYWDPSNNVVPTLLIMLAGIVIEVALLYVLNNRELLRSCCGPAEDFSEESASGSEELQRLGIKEDDDVVRERERCISSATAGNSGRNSGSGSRDLLCVQGLAKQFVTSGGLCASSPGSTFVAVRNSSFGVRRGDVLGLLGPNGAGKTTTIAMVTGEEAPSSGNVFVCGRNMQTEKWAAMQHMGFCPQFSALWENITTEEHLLFFARIKGRTTAQAHALKRGQLSLLGIKEHEKKQSKNLSGGTQRKLSVAIALINSPDVCLLDEPSTGLDPQSRRVLWDVIKKRLRTTAAVLTTHSMEEAEALCNKIAIMVKGRLVCFGSPTHLKNTYGTGYTLEIKTKASATEAVHAFVQDNLPNAQQEEGFSGFLSYQLEIKDTHLADVFSLLEENKERLHISEYALSQSTLEQVFLRFAKLQDIEP